MLLKDKQDEGVGTRHKGKYLESAEGKIGGDVRQCLR